MRDLTDKQVLLAAKRVVEELNKQFPFLNIPPRSEQSMFDTATSFIALLHDHVGMIHIYVTMDNLGLFLHARVQDPKRFSHPSRYNSHSGKYNLHIHKNGAKFEDFCQDMVLSACWHIRELIDYKPVAVAA